MHRLPGGSRPLALTRRSAAGPGVDTLQVGSILESLDLAGARLRAHRSVPLLGGAALTPRHLAILGAVSADGERSVGEVAVATGLALQAVSRLAGELCAGGLMRRREDPSDRRRSLLGVVPERRAAITALLEPRAAAVRRALAGMPPADQAALARGLRLVAAALDAADPASGR